MNKKYIKLHIQPLSGKWGQFKSTLNWDLKEQGGRKQKTKQRQKQTEKNPAKQAGKQVKKHI